MLRGIRAPWYVRVFMLVVMSASAAHGQTTTFTYQGQVCDAGAPANSSYDLRFALFDSAAGGAQIGANQDVSAVTLIEEQPGRVAFDVVVPFVDGTAELRVGVNIALGTTSGDPRPSTRAATARSQSRS